MIFIANDELYHHGVKGMKWGVRRYQNYDGSLKSQGKRRYTERDENGVTKHKEYTIKTRSGETLTMSPHSYNKLLAKVSKRYRKMASNEYGYDIKDHTGRKVGDLDLELQDNGKTTYVNWISTNKYGRGKGYGRDTLEFVEQFAREQGSEKITAEVVGMSPQINHLVDSLGYKRLDQVSNDDIWDGLTYVEKYL